ncbi:SemiSWEET transporter [Tepidimonas sp.]|uniref:SemiSWEET transporter n=1 Tax=Tepidimonas sp. TaxID=2002775 RepID=UPI00391D6719
MIPAGWTEAIGTLAAILTTASFVPQAWRTWRTRDAAGISIGMYAIFAFGVALWLVYGILLGAWPIIVANAITLTLALMILAMCLCYRRGPAAAPAAEAERPR